MCCGIMLLYPVKIYHLYWFNKMLIYLQPGRKYSQGDQTRRILEGRKVQYAVANQMQRKQDENMYLS